MRYGAFGMVEVVGRSNAVLVTDKLLKTAAVSFLNWNCKCGGHVVVFVTGDVAAVTSSVQAVTEQPPCNIVTSAVVSNPSEEMIRLVEEDAVRNHLM